MNTKVVITLCFLSFVTLGCVSGHGKKPTKTDSRTNLYDTDIFPLLLLNYKIHTRLLCGRLLEHFAVEDLRKQASSAIEKAEGGRLDKNSEWLKNISVAFFEPFPSTGVVNAQAPHGELPI